VLIANVVRVQPLLPIQRSQKKAKKTVRFADPYTKDSQLQQLREESISDYHTRAEKLFARIDGKNRAADVTLIKGGGAHARKRNESLGQRVLRFRSSWDADDQVKHASKG
jgi:hypothetical protein